jgi:hypothetical protein
MLEEFGAGGGIRARDFWQRAFSPFYLQISHGVSVSPIMSLAP